MLPVPFPVTLGYTINELVVSLTVAVQFAAKAPAPNLAAVVMSTVKVVSPPESVPPVSGTDIP